jgi:hypothetical protein
VSRRDRPRAEPLTTPREAAPPVDTTDHATIGGAQVPLSRGDLGRPQILGRIIATAPAAMPPAGAVWNGIRRAWLVPGPAGVLVVADPQPPPPERSFTTGAPAADVPPSVKISA